jgi:signal transduction histidine kinase
MGLHQWFDGTGPQLLISSSDDDTPSQPPAEMPKSDQPLPPWLDVSFLNRLDALNAPPQMRSDRSPRTFAGTETSVAESIAAFAHEVRTPLSTIYATLELLSDDTPPDDDLQQLVGRLQRGVTWITELVEGLSNWSEAANGTHDGAMPLVMEPTSVRDWIERAIALVQPIADHRKQSILFACPRPVPVVCGDQFQLGQVIVNLLTNACRYGAWADTIAVSVIAGNGFVTIRVSDHGMGVLPEERDRIFERLVRGTQTGEHHIHGQGLGLHIVRGIVERHGGTIGVESTVGQGSTFSVRLPAMQALRPLILRHAVIEESEVAE